MQDKVNRVTIRDVAKMAGVSFQTVSLVINHPEKVADETRERVKRAITALHFVPSMAARSLRRMPSRTLACIFFGERASYDNRSFQIQDTYWNNVVQMLTRVADSLGYSLLQRSQTGDGEAALAEIRELFAAGRIDGMVAVVEQSAHPVLAELHRQGFPFVVFGTRDTSFPFVAQANEQATAQIVGHLHEGGCRRIAFISGERDGHANEDVSARHRGYLKAMKKYKLPVDNRWQLAGDWSLASGHGIARELCASDDRPDALIFASDRMALGALKGLHELGVRVPQDVSVVGFDNMQFDDFSIPPLTSVHSPVLEMADAAVRFLLEQMEDKGSLADRQQVFAAPLVIRESTRGPTLAPAAMLMASKAASGKRK
jgi:DNA-binding LacI/PurR family transcriptional regulator